MKIVAVSDSEIRVKIINGRTTPIFVNQQPPKDSKPGLLGARIICRETAGEIDHGERTDAALPLLSIESGVEIEFTLWIFKPLSQSRGKCMVTTRYIENPKAVELIYQATQSPTGPTLEDDAFIRNSEKYLSVPID